MKNKYVYTLVSLLIILAASFFIMRFYKGPAYSLCQSKKAVLNHDYVGFSKYINIDSVINNYVVKLPARLPEPLDTLEELVIKLGRSAVFGLKPQMTRIVNKLLKKAIEQGKMDYLFASNDKKASFKIPTIDKWKNWKAVSFIKTDYIFKQGSTARAGLLFKNHNKGNQFVIRIRMIKKDKHWQIVEFSNLYRILRQ